MYFWECIVYWSEGDLADLLDEFGYGGIIDAESLIEGLHDNDFGFITTVVENF
jgi:hypothetical protein